MVPLTDLNEAAERLRRLVTVVGRDPGAIVMESEQELRDLLDTALLTERRLTVERIRERLAEKVIRRGPDDDGGFYPAHSIRAILDEVTGER